MSLESLKYNRLNFTPDHLFRPATARTHGELLYLANQLSLALEGKGRRKDRRLLIGTELEMFFFNPDKEPSKAYDDWYNYGIPNPNYTNEHLDKIDKLANFARQLEQKRPTEFMFTERQGRIFLEFHTAPQGVPKHIATVERFGDLLRAECQKLGVLPVVHSQHIHVSLRNNPVNPVSYLREDDRDEVYGFTPDDDITINSFSGIVPLMLLPEEWDSREYTPHYMKDDGFVGNKISDLTHPEFRMLSSEYAFDPLLNLVVSLRAMYDGCIGLKPGECVTYPDDYLGSVDLMTTNPDLLSFFGKSTLEELGRVVRQYPDVSARKITLDQIR